MPPTKRRTALKEKNNDEPNTIMDKLEAELRNWEAGAATERKMLEAECASAKQRMLDGFQSVLDSLPDHLLDMKVSDYVEYMLNRKSEEPESQPDPVGMIDQELKDLEADRGVTKGKKGGRKKKKPVVSRTALKDKKQPTLSLQTPSMAPGAMKDTPFMTPLVRSRLLDAAPLTATRMATEADLLRGCQTRIQLVSHAGSPITLPVDNLMLARELQRRCLDDYMKVGEEWKKGVE